MAQVYCWRCQALCGSAGGTLLKKGVSLGSSKTQEIVFPTSGTTHFNFQKSKLLPNFWTTSRIRYATYVILENNSVATNIGKLNFFLPFFIRESSFFSCFNETSVSLLSKTWKTSCLLKAAQKYRVYHRLRNDLSISAHIRERGQKYILCRSALWRETITCIVENDTGMSLKDGYIIIIRFTIYQDFYTSIGICTGIFKNPYLMRMLQWLQQMSQVFDSPGATTDPRLCWEGLSPRWWIQSRHIENELDISAMKTLGRLGPGAWGPKAWWGRRQGWGWGVHMGQPGDKFGTPCLLIKSQEICLKGVIEP